MAIKALDVRNSEGLLNLNYSGVFFSAKGTRFSEVFYFVTPNMISLAGVLSALAAAKLVTSESLAMQRCAVLLMTLRTWFDALDGLVARSRMGLVRHLSIRDTSGYLVDGLADTIGFAVFLLGCFFCLRKRPPTSKRHIFTKPSECGAESTALYSKQKSFISTVMSRLYGYFRSPQNSFVVGFV